MRLGLPHLRQGCLYGRVRWLLSLPLLRQLLNQIISFASSHVKLLSQARSSFRIRVGDLENQEHVAYAVPNFGLETYLKEMPTASGRVRMSSTPLR